MQSSHKLSCCFHGILRGAESINNYDATMSHKIRVHLCFSKFRFIFILHPQRELEFLFVVFIHTIMEFFDKFLLCISLCVGVSYSNGSINIRQCPSQTQSTLKMAESIDQLTRVLNQTFNADQHQSSENAMLDVIPSLEGTLSVSFQSFLYNYYYVINVPYF